MTVVSGFMKYILILTKYSMNVGTCAKKILIQILLLLIIL